MNRARFFASLLSSIVIVAASLGAPARARADADISGTWEWKGDAVSITLQLDANGAGKLDANAITWSQSGPHESTSQHETGVLTIVSDGEKIAYAYNIAAAGDRLTLSGGDLDKATTFTRRSAHGIGAHKAGAAPQPNLPPQHAPNAPMSGGEPAGTTEPPPPPSAPVTGEPPVATPQSPAPPPGTPATPSPSVAGFWDMHAQNGVVVHMDLDADGTGALGSVGGSVAPASSPLEWTFDAGTLTLRLPKNTIKYACTLSNDQLTLSGGDLGQPATFSRRAARPPADPAMLRRLVGLWRGQDGVDSEIRADGTLLQQGQTMKISATADTLTFVGAGGPVDAGYRLDGDALTIAAGNGQTQTFHRVGAAGAKAPPPPAVPTEAQSPQAPAQVTPPDALTGVWVCEEASVDPTIAMTYTQYVTLYPDGAVGYSKSEGGASRQLVSDTQERFRSWHDRAPADVYGKWTSDGHTITVRWNHWNNLVSQGAVDAARGAMTLSGMGVVQEGATLTFKRQ